MIWQKKYSQRKNPNRRLYVLAATLPLLFILIPAIYFGLRFANRTRAVWMDDSWQYRVKVPVTAHTGAETNKYFTKTVDTSDTTRFQADCGDIRFTDVGGKILSYYIASGCSSASTVIHVLVPDFTAGATDYYMYYGNPSAPDGFSASDFTAGSLVTVGTLGGEEKGVGPVAYWSFGDGNGTTAQDGTNNNNDGTLSNGPTWKAEGDCISGKCISLDGTDDIVTVTNSTAIDLDATGGLASGFTVEAWIRPNGAGEGTGGQIFFKGTNTWLKVTNLTSGLLDLSASVDLATTDATLTASAKVTNNQWTHVALSYTDDGDDEITIWVNGVSVGSSTNGVGSLATDTNNFVIGGTTTNNFAGSIDEMKIYNAERSAAQMRVDYNSRGGMTASSTVQGTGNARSLSNGLVGYWKMDEASWATDCSTASVLDSSGNGNNARPCPNASAATQGVGKFGKSGSFDGTNDYLEIPTATSLHPGDTFTLSAWVKRSGTGTFDAILGTGADDFQLAFVNDNIKLSRQSTSDVFVSTSTYTDTTNWHHIVASKNGSTSATVYVDGQPIAGTYTNQTIIAGSSSVYIGGDGNGADILAGSIDEVRIYNRALSPAEVSQLYASAPGPVAYWKLDDNTGSSAIDSSGNTNTGSLGGALSWTQGKLGGGVTYPTAGGTCISAGTGASITNLPSLTISAWIKPTSEGSDSGVGRIVGKDPGYSFLVGDTAPVNTTNGLTFTKGYATTELKVQSANNVWTANTWQYVTVTWNGSQTASTAVKMYVNGVETTYQTQQNGVGSTSSDVNGLAIGAFSAASCNFADFEGALDDVKIYNYARTPSQIIEDMNGSHPIGGSPVGSQLIYWNMDEQATAVINNTGSGGSTYNGSANGPQWSTITVPSCKVNGCLYFDTAADYTNTSLGTILNGASAFATSLWIKPTSLAGGTMIVSKANTTTQRAFQILEDSANTNSEIKVMISSIASDTSNYCITNGFGLSTTAWQHLSVSYDGSQPTGDNNRIKVYKNGFPIPCVVTGTIPTSLPATTSLLKLGQGDDTTPNSVTAYIDEFKFYTVPLSADQVKIEANYGASTAYSTGSDEPTQITGTAETVGIGYWPFEENSGTLASNKFGTSYDGTLNNSPTWMQSSNCKVGHCLSFASASSQDISVANTVLGIKTVSFWAKPTSTTTSLLQLQASGAVAITATAGTLSATGFTSPTIYVNGSLSSTIVANVWQYITVTTGTSISGSAVKFGHVNATYYDGQLDEIKMYNYARTKAQVNYDYNRGAPIGWWQFDECQGSSAFDASGNGSTATLTYGGGTYTQVGTCNSGTSSDAWYGGVSGRFNGGIAIDSTTDTINVGNVSLYSFDRTDPFTTSIWFKTSTLQSSTLFSKQDSSAPFSGWNIQTDNTGKLYFQFVNTYSSNILERRTTSAVAYTDGNWHNVTTTYDGSSSPSGVHIYYDGNDQVLTTDFNSLSAATTNSISVYIGSRNGTAQKYSGLLDDVRLYNYALSSSQVKKLIINGSSINFGPAIGSP